MAREAFGANLEKIIKNIKDQKTSSQNMQISIEDLLQVNTEDASTTVIKGDTFTEPKQEIQKTSSQNLQISIEDLLQVNIEEASTVIKEDTITVFQSSRLVSDDMEEGGKGVPLRSVQSRLCLLNYCADLYIQCARSSNKSQI